MSVQDKLRKLLRAEKRWLAIASATHVDSPKFTTRLSNYLIICEERKSWENIND
ncbi:MAG: hypothetical protein IBX55_09955 [Methyloprofundus sp.]|nr:hypothetical protein [Methyloprofundus sp.]